MSKKKSEPVDDPKDTRTAETAQEPPANSDQDALKLSDGQRATQPLLERFGIILTPPKIEDEAYEQMTWALHLGRALHPDKPLELRCYGEGGDSYAMLAIVNLIRADGNVDGVLVGDAGSASSVIWASCQRRYVHPLASLNVHGARQVGGGWNSQAERAWLESLEWVDTRIADIYAAASDKAASWWLEKMAAGHGACSLMPAEEIVAIGMARPITER